MSMESVAWDMMYKSSTSPTDRRLRRDRRTTLRRIGGFARPHRRRIAAFLVLSVFTAVLTVVTPLLAGRVVNLITGGGSDAGAAIVGLAALIAFIAVVEAAVSVVVRWLSSTIGEGLILDLRRAVFDHVQRMPVAFFTRTRTGALVSRLNNDVIGAQRAFSDTLSGVVSNIVTLALTLGVMIAISWEVTILALILLPVFVIPARRMGRRMASLSRAVSYTHLTLPTSDLV